MHEKGLGPHKTQYRRDENYSKFLNMHILTKYENLIDASWQKKSFAKIAAALLCWVTPDFELYAAFDPLADKVRFFLSLFE